MRKNLKGSIRVITVKMFPSEKKSIYDFISNTFQSPVWYLIISDMCLFFSYLFIFPQVQLTSKNCIYLWCTMYYFDVCTCGLYFHPVFLFVQ